MSTITDACYSLADDCRSNGTRFRLGPVLENVRVARGAWRTRMLLRMHAFYVRSMSLRAIHEPCMPHACMHIARGEPHPAYVPTHTQSHPAPQVLRGMLPADVARSVSGRTYVAVTRVLPEDGRLLAPRLVSEFDDRDDLISALMTSCHIPIYMNGSLVTRFRGAPHFDGGARVFPRLSRPHARERTSGGMSGAAHAATHL